MPGKEPADKVQREIEELLEKLDNFVPEERLRTKIRARRKQARRPERTGPGPLQRMSHQFGRITLGQVMIAGLILLAVSFLFDGPLGAAAFWLTLAGIILTAGAFVLSVVNGRGARSTISGRVQRRWRGQVIEYGEPTTVERVRSWWRRMGRR